MNREQLRNRLKEIGIGAARYSLAGGMPDNKLCMDTEDGRWIVYYSERGIRTFEESFDTEVEACECFLNKFISWDLK